jgi:hypothetical protein
MNPFDAPKNYSEMLTKIATFTFVVALGATWLLRAKCPQANQLLATLDLKVKVFDTELALGYVLPALVVAIASRMLKLHDRLSDLFRVRSQFDVHEILTVLAGAVGLPVTLALREKMRSDRKTLMNRVFYRYASSSADAPAVDKHLIHMALDNWSWFWIAWESSLVAVLTSCLLVWLNQCILGVALLVLAGVLLLVAQLPRRKCVEYAHQQVAAITSDPGRASEIRGVFNALHS